MMKHLAFLGLLFFATSIFAQKDSLQLGDKYLEDQLYVALTYNVLRKQPETAISTGFSYGVSAGYIRDIPFNRKGNWASGIGVGYSFDSFNHQLVYNAEKFSVSQNLSYNKFSLHTVEVPIQLRWRTSNAVTYSFWRIYAGIKLSYNLSNSFNYILNNTDYNFSNISGYNKFQTGVEVSLGYSAFNFYMYYGLTPMYKNMSINGATINTKIAKFGLIMYLL